MATLGDMLAMARDSADDFGAWIEGADPEMAAAINEARQARDLSTPVFVRAAISDFSNYADEEAWASLLSAIRDSDDPATACLGSMVRWRLSHAHPV